MNFLDIFEAASCDGYTTQGSGQFFVDKYTAEKFANEKDGGHADVLRHPAIQASDGKYYLLKSRDSVNVNEDIIEDIRKAALAKLTKEERIALGLPYVK
jgi:hypothetical protein